MIRVGEYVRTPYHKIEKIEKIEKVDWWICVTTDKNDYELEWLKNNKVKHSKNIIDLLEIGDIVVMLDTKFNTKDYIFIDDKERLKAVKEDLKDRCKLLEVLTHEQFEANCYKIKQK